MARQESQNDLGWGGDLLRSFNPTHPDQVQPPKAICPGLCPDGF